VAFREGQEVKAGDLLAEIDPRPYQALLSQAKAKKAEDEAQQFAARVTYDRNFALLKQGLMDQQTVDTNRASRDQMEALVQADQAAIEQDDVELGYCTIRSPIDGPHRHPSGRSGQCGPIHQSDRSGGCDPAQNRSRSSSPFPSRTGPRSSIWFPPARACQTLAMGDGPTPLDQGKLEVVDNQIDTTTGTIKLKATFPNPMLAAPGRASSSRPPARPNPQGRHRGAGERYPARPAGRLPFVIGSDSTVKARLVQVAQIDGGIALIDGGWPRESGWWSTGQYKLQDGSRVTTSSPHPPGPGQAKAAKS